MHILEKNNPVTSICKIHNDCDFTVVVREKVDGYLMDLVDAGKVHPPGGGTSTVL